MPQIGLILLQDALQKIGNWAHKASQLDSANNAACFSMDCHHGKAGVPARSCLNQTLPANTQVQAMAKKTTRMHLEQVSAEVIFNSF